MAKAGYDIRMGEARALEVTSRLPRNGSQWGLSARLVDTQASPRTRRRGIVHIGDMCTVCSIEGSPLVGDFIRTDRLAVIEKIRVTRDGDALIYCRPVEHES